MLHRRAEDRSGAEMPNPNLFYFVHSEHPDPKAAAELLAELRRLEIVETAYFQPIPFDAVDIRANDDDRRHAAAGLLPSVAYGHRRRHGAPVCWGTRRGRPDRRHRGRVEHRPRGSAADRASATASTGALSVASTGRRYSARSPRRRTPSGRTASPPSSAIGWSSVTNIDLLRPWLTYFYSVANALLASLYFLRQGDIALIEQHYPNPFAGPCPTPATAPSSATWRSRPRRRTTPRSG